MITAIFIYIDALAPLLVLFYWLRYSKWSVTAELLPLLFFLLIQFVLNTIADVFSNYSFTFYTFNSNSLYHINLPLSLIAQLFFFKTLGSNIYFTKSLLIGGIVLTAIVVMNSFVYENITTFNGSSYALKCIYILYVCLRYYWYKIHSDDTSDILQQPYFWFISGFFIYYCSCFIIFAAYNGLVIQNDQLTIISRRFQGIVYIAMCIMLAKGIKQTAYAK
jgi:hypothetical protein